MRVRSGIARGFTLIELVIAVAIVAILASAALPLNELVVQRSKEQDLRRALRDIRTAIDSGDAASVQDAVRNTVSLVDKMAGKGIIHRNAAGRYKSRLMAKLDA